MKIGRIVLEGHPKTVSISGNKQYATLRDDFDFYNNSTSPVKDGGPMLKTLRGEKYLIPIPEVRSIRDFYTFEEHAKKARARRGLEMSEEWYEIPAYYYSGTSMLFPSGADIPYPEFTSALDYEMEVAAIIGKDGINIGKGRGLSHLFGFTLANDWSARDIQRKEMKIGLGPSKSKDFATSIGPYVTTMDELQEAKDEAGKIDMLVEAYVNGKKYSGGNLKDMHYTFQT